MLRPGRGGASRPTVFDRASIVDAEAAVIVMLNTEFFEEHGEGCGAGLELVRVAGRGISIRPSLGELSEEQMLHRGRQGRRCLRRSGDGAGVHWSYILAPMSDASTVISGDNAIVNPMAIYGWVRRCGLVIHLGM